jgi:predicted DNA-binding transcriptional regulator YafY
MSFTPETLLRHWQTLRLIPRYPRRVSSGEILKSLAGEGYVVGKRTIERDLLALSRIFPLVVDERSKPYGWSWIKDAPAFDLPGISTSESLTLLMARQFLCSVMPSSLNTQLAPYFRSAEQKLTSLEGHSVLAGWLSKVRIIPANQPLLLPQINEAVSATIQDALLFDRQCLVSYQTKEAGQPDQYPINPLGLVQRGGLIYLVCTIKTYQQPRILVLHRMQAAQLLESPAFKPDDFDLDQYLETGAFGWSVGGGIRLEFLISIEAGAHLYETRLSEDQSIAVEPGGRLKVTATVPETKQLQWWLLGFGDALEVVAPQSLRLKVSEQLIAAAQKYQTQN